MSAAWDWGHLGLQGIAAVPREAHGICEVQLAQVAPWQIGPIAPTRDPQARVACLQDEQSRLTPEGSGHCRTPAKPGYPNISARRLQDPVFITVGHQGPLHDSRQRYPPREAQNGTHENCPDFRAIQSKPSNKKIVIFRNAPMPTHFLSMCINKLNRNTRKVLQLILRVVCKRDMKTGT